MPNINPPVDRAEAMSRPAYLYDDRITGVQIRLGPVKTAETLPEAMSFRYAYIRTPSQEWFGYLYMEEDGSIVPREDPATRS